MMSSSGEKEDRIAAGDRRIQQAIDALPSLDDPEFWSIVTARGTAIPSEVLVHVYRAFRQRGCAADIANAERLLILRAYGIAEGIMRHYLRSRPDDQADAVHDAFITMWRHVNGDDLHWERNFRGAMTAACASACRQYYRQTNSDTPLSAVPQREGSTDHNLRLWDVAAETAVATALTHIDYERALALLDEETCAIVRLVVEHDLKRKDIAARLQCDVKTVYNHLITARRIFADAFMEGEKG